MTALTRSRWHEANLKRVTAVALAIAMAAGLLFSLLAGLGDSDLPPYDPPFPGERAGWAFLAVILWPLRLTSLVTDHDPPLVAVLLLFFISGLFWAALLELAIMWKQRPKT